MAMQRLRRALTVSAAILLAVPAAPLAAQHSADTLTSDMTVDGLHIILRRNTANNVVAANLYLLGGARQVTSANAGIEPLLLNVSERGTVHYPKEVLLRKMSLLGTEIVVAPGDDWTIFGVRSTTSAFDSTWAIFADRLMAPALQPSEVELVRSQFISGVQQKNDDPDDLVSSLADSMAFAGHPYGIDVAGTATSLRSITVAQMRAYQQSQFVKSRMMLVVVGNVTRGHVEALVHATLAKLPLGTYHWTLPPPAPTLPPGAVFVQRTLPTNYILGYFSGPLASSPDYQNLRLAMTVLTGAMFSEIRSRENLTYDVHAPFLDRAATSGGLYVTTVSPDTTLKLMRLFVWQMQQQTLTFEALQRLELSFVTDYFLQNETNDSQADFLARAQLYQGDYHHAMTFVDELRSVTPEAVQLAAQTYIKNIRFAYVGDSTKVDRRLLEGF
jgi:zinc protease